MAETEATITRLRPATQPSPRGASKAEITRKQDDA
jgi:hypothetical protein